MNGPTSFTESNAFLAACEGDRDAVREIIREMMDHELNYAARGTDVLYTEIRAERLRRRAQEGGA